MTHSSPDRPAAPLASQKPVQAVHHGQTIDDPFAWLRAPNWQEVMRQPATLDPEIRAYLEAENAHTDALLADTAELQATLFAEMKARLKADDSTVPAPHGAFEYFSAFIEGGQYPRLLRRPRGEKSETLLLDGNAHASGKAYWDLGGSSHSPDHTLLAYATDEKGSELYTIRVRDLATGLDLDDAILDSRGDMVWANDSRTLYYIRVDGNLRPRAVLRHTLGTPVETDEVVYEEADESFFIALSKTQSGQFVLINAHDHETSEVHYANADDATAKFQMIAPRTTGHEYGVEHNANRFIISTNSEGAEDFRIVAAPLDAPAQSNWREIVPHKLGRLILDVGVYKDHMVRHEREDSLPRLVIHSFSDRAEHSIAIAEDAYALGHAYGYE